MSPPQPQTELIEQDTAVRHDSAPIGDSGDVGLEFKALLGECGFSELGDRGYAILTGADRTRWLNGMITNNIRDLQQNSGVYGFLLTAQGRIMGDLYAYNRGDSIFLAVDLPQREKVLGLLRRYIIMDKVTITDVSDKFKTIAVVGPKSPDVLRAAGLVFPQLQPLQFTDINWNGLSFTLIRGDRPRIESYEILGESVGSLLGALKAGGATPVSAVGLNLLRIAEGSPKYGEDIRERDLPQETGQERALSFTKGCYIGQEIVERIRSRGNVHRKFAGFAVDGPLPAPGTKIQIDQKESGEITSSALLPLRQGAVPVALGYIRREVESSGKQIELNGAKLTVTKLPFHIVFES